MQPELTETELITIVTLIIETYKCTIENINFEKNILNIDCPKKNEIKVAMELEKALGKYCVPDKPPKEITWVKDGVGWEI